MKVSATPLNIKVLSNKTNSSKTEFKLENNTSSLVLPNHSSVASKRGSGQKENNLLQRTQNYIMGGISSLLLLHAGSVPNNVSQRIIEATVGGLGVGIAISREGKRGEKEGIQIGESKVEELRKETQEQFGKLQVDLEETNNRANLAGQTAAIALKTAAAAQTNYEIALNNQAGLLKALGEKSGSSEQELQFAKLLLSSAEQRKALEKEKGIFQRDISSLLKQSSSLIEQNNQLKTDGQVLKESASDLRKNVLMALVKFEENTDGRIPPISSDEWLSTNAPEKANTPVVGSINYANSGNGKNGNGHHQ